MTESRPLIDYDTAKELASFVAKHGSADLEADDYYLIIDDLSQEHPWGWIFEPVVEPYWSNQTVCPYGGAWKVTVDRFNGKVQIIGHSEFENITRPIIKLILHDVGDDIPGVFKLLRQITGWTAFETKEKMGTLPVVVTTGSMITVRSIHESFLSRGAIVMLEQIYEKN